MRSAQIPKDLRDALDALARRIAPSALAEAARRVSSGYRAGEPAKLSREVDLAAYVLTRLPATYGAIFTCLREIEFTPRTLIDYGAGPGTSAWAAQAAFGALERITLIEQNTNWAEFSPALGLPKVEWRHADLRRLADNGERAELAIISYVLNELTPSDQERLVELAWTSSTRALLIVEPGTPEGWRRIFNVRAQLLEVGAHIAAPCPHANACPLDKDDWCHFAVRVDRSKAHRAAKGGELGYEDEKFSYVLATREPVEQHARVLRHPVTTPGHIDVRVCTVDGIAELGVHKKHPAWKRARKAEWGARWAVGE